VLSSLQAYESNMTGIETTDDNEGEVDLDHQGIRRNDDLGGKGVDVNTASSGRVKRSPA